MEIQRVRNLSAVNFDLGVLSCLRDRDAQGSNLNTQNFLFNFSRLLLYPRSRFLHARLALVPVVSKALFFGHGCVSSRFANSTAFSLAVHQFVGSLAAIGGGAARATLSASVGEGCTAIGTHFHRHLVGAHLPAGLTSTQGCRVFDCFVQQLTVSPLALVWFEGVVACWSNGFVAVLPDPSPIMLPTGVVVDL